MIKPPAPCNLSFRLFIKWGHALGSSEYSGILAKIDSSYSLAACVELFELIGEIGQQFIDMPVSRMPHAETIDLKYVMMHWRRSMKGKLLRDFSALEGVFLHKQWIQSLGDLNIYFTLKECSQILKCCRKGQFFKQLQGDLASFFALQGHLELHKNCEGSSGNICGPQKSLSMVANRKSRAKLEKWGNDPEFQRYYYADGGVVYRGIKFLPGDVLLCSVNLGGNGCFTSFSEPRNYCFHSGFFCMIPCGDKRVPVVMEVYEMGVRAVPLSHFLGKKFSNYIEVLRSDQISSQHYLKLGRRALEQTEKTLGYNFDTEDSDRTFMACTTAGTDLYEYIGVTAVAAKSSIINSNIADNLNLFGLCNHKFLFPVDFLIDQQMSRVGVIDNDAFEACIAQELSDRFFKDVFASGKINFGRLPFFYHLIYFAASAAKKGNFLGKIVEKVAGFPGERLPKGDNKVIGMIENCAFYVARMERKLERRIAGSIKYDRRFQLDDFCSFWWNDSRIKKIYRPLRKWFSLS